MERECLCFCRVATSDGAVRGTTSRRVGVGGQGAGSRVRIRIRIEQGVVL